MTFFTFRETLSLRPLGSQSEVFFYAIVAGIVLTRWATGVPSNILRSRQNIAALVTPSPRCRTVLQVGVAFLNLEQVPVGTSGTVFAEVEVTA